jgi:predicted transcriptional regulator
MPNVSMLLLFLFKTEYSDYQKVASSLTRFIYKNMIYVVCGMYFESIASLDDTLFPHQVCLLHLLSLDLSSNPSSLNDVKHDS